MIDILSRFVVLLILSAFLLACGGGGGGSSSSSADPFDPDSQLDREQHGVADLQLVPAITGDITFRWKTPTGLNDFISINHNISHYNFSWSGSEQQTETEPRKILRNQLYRKWLRRR